METGISHALDCTSVHCARLGSDSEEIRSRSSREVIEGKVLEGEKKGLHKFKTGFNLKVSFESR